jgi:hypothetical protein
VLELAILGLLEEQPLHGYELKKRLGDTLGSLSGVSYGSLYPAPRRLERAGAIEIVAPGSGSAAPASASPPTPATGSIDGERRRRRRRDGGGVRPGASDARHGAPPVVTMKP